MCCQAWLATVAIFLCHCRGTLGISFVDPTPTPNWQEGGVEVLFPQHTGLFCEGALLIVTDKRQEEEVREGPQLGLSRWQHIWWDATRMKSLLTHCSRVACCSLCSSSCLDSCCRSRSGNMLCASTVRHKERTGHGEDSDNGSLLQITGCQSAPFYVLSDWPRSGCGVMVTEGMATVYGKCGNTQNSTVIQQKTNIRFWETTAWLLFITSSDLLHCFTQ